MQRRRAVISAMPALFAARPALSAAKPATLVSGELRIGTYFVNPPFEFLENGRQVGYEVDLMTQIAQRLGLKPTFVNTHWETILGEMQRHHYDCIVGGITITAARERTLAWSVPYMTTTLSLIVNGAKTPAIDSIADLKSSSVGVQAATTDYDIAVRMAQKGEIGRVVVYPFDRIEEAMTDLLAGRIAAVMKVAPVAAWLARQQGGLRIIGQVPDDPQPLGIGFAKSESALVGAVNEVLAALHSDGTLRRLAAQWGVPG